MPTIDAKNNVGESIGSVMCQNSDQRPAPSMRALSYNSSSIVCKPASRITVNSPMFIQPVASDTEINAQLGSMNQAVNMSHGVARSPIAQPPSSSQFTLERPTASKPSLSTPMLGCSSTSQRTALIATDAASVDEKIVRKMTIPGSFWFEMTARNVPIAIAGTTV